MNEVMLNRLISDVHYLDELYDSFLAKGTISLQKPVLAEIEGHFKKADHNLKFITHALDGDFTDWALVGCYYACYHAVLATILSKGYSSKNHFATFCILNKECYNTDISKEDVSLLSSLLSYDDALFYVESKQKRELASYSSKLLFSTSEVLLLQKNAISFVSKLHDLVYTQK